MPVSAIRISRPKQQWKASPATLLPTGLLFRLFKPQSDFTVVLDGQAVGQIGKEQARVFEVEPGEHRVHMRFVGLRRSEELRVSLKADEERQFICGSSGMGWPTLREASPDEVAQIRRTSISEPPTLGDLR
jgi:hypothetical protein